MKDKDLGFGVAAIVERPVAEVYAAVARASARTVFFGTDETGDDMLQAGDRLSWWDDVPVDIVMVEPERAIALSWASDHAAPEQDGRTMVSIAFESLAPGATRVRISEEGWRFSQAALRESYDRCEGWVQMLCSLKAFLEHAVDLRRTYYDLDAAVPAKCA